jgi:cation:H+ antiporter
LGGKLVIDGAITIAILLGMSESFVGLTIVALGTSLPELAASVMAALKGERDIAIGNIIGSNIFNFLWVIGLVSVISPITFNTALNIDLIILLIITLFLYFLIFTGKKQYLKGREGVILIGLYLGYIAYLILRG